MNSDEEPNTYLIPDEVCRRAGIAATIGTNNKFTMFPYQHVTAKSSDKPSIFAPCESKIHVVEEESIIFDPIIRKLVSEACGVFIDLQETMKKDDIEKRTELLQFSKNYRAIIRACLENLKDECKKETGERREEITSHITVFYSIECVWHLCEMFFVDVVPGDILLPQFLNWVRFHFPKHDKNATSILNSEIASAEIRPDYWDTVIGCLMQGRIDLARCLLQMHSAVASSPFQLVDTALKQMPIYNEDSGMTKPEFDLKRKYWQNDCQSKIDAKLFASEKHLDLIMRLIIGNEEAWEAIRPKFESWYEILADWLFFFEPTITSSELGQFAHKWLNRCGGKEQMSHLDYVILAILNFDLTKILREFNFMSENNWFLAHLGDLLYHCSELQDQPDNIKISATLRESFVVDFGTILMQNNSFWQAGLKYLDYCPIQGIHVIECLLSRLTLDNESRTSKIIKEAKKRKLNNVAQSICKIQGMKFLHMGYNGKALTWAVKSHDGYLISIIAEKYLQEYSNTGKFSDKDLLDNLGSSMLLSDKLIFLGKYVEFQNVYQSGNFKVAAEILISLMSSNLAPKYFWVTFMMDALPLLECDELVLSSSDSIIILKCLEERLDMPGMEDKINLLRLAISKNIARALIAEINV